ncbi:unnamed protein product [Closterium sp. Yama58-4]|nr:unnamed protein product [Closterium sp. Yama58-4]
MVLLACHLHVSQQPPSPSLSLSPSPPLPLSPSNTLPLSPSAPSKYLASAQPLPAAACSASRLCCWCYFFSARGGMIPWCLLHVVVRRLLASPSPSAPLPLCPSRYLAFAALLNRTLLLPVAHPASAAGASRPDGSWFQPGLRSEGNPAGSFAAKSHSLSSSTTLSSFLFSTSPHSLPDASVSGLPLSRVPSNTRRRLVGREGSKRKDMEERRVGERGEGRRLLHTGRTGERGGIPATKEPVANTPAPGITATIMPDRRAIAASGDSSGVLGASGVSSGVLSGAPAEWMDLGVALDVAGLQQCVGQGRVLTVGEYMRGEGVGSGGEGWLGRVGGLWNQRGGRGRRREVEVKMWWWWHGGESVRATCQQFIREAPWAKLLPHDDDDGSGGVTDGATAGDSNSADSTSTTSSSTSAAAGTSGNGGDTSEGAGKDSNINDPAYLARVCAAPPIPAANVSLRQFLSFFGRRTEQVIGLGDVFEVTGKVDEGEVREVVGEMGDVEKMGGNLREVEASQTNLLLEGHASSDGLPGLYDGVNGAVPILPSCRLAMRPHPATLSAAHAFARRVLGTRFAALHLRRTDFATHCLRPGFRCWLPLSQIARCVADRINALNAAAAATDTTAAGATASGGGAGGKDGNEQEQQQQQHHHQPVRTLFVATDTTDQVSESVALPEAGLPVLVTAVADC